VGLLKRINEKAAHSDDHERFAAERGLTYEAIGDLPEVTPLLRAAEAKNFSSVMRGKLGDTIQGYAAMMSRLDREDYGDDSGIQTSFEQVVLVGAPQAAEFIPKLTVSCRNGLQPLATDERLREIETESETVTRRHRIWIGPETEEGNVRELLSPVTLDWLAGLDLRSFAFELDAGWFSAWSHPSVFIPFVKQGKPEELASLMETANSLVERILAEVAEE
jgi:hypothetical protein